MLSMFASSAAFQGPAMMAGGRSTAVQMRAEGEIGVTPPLGVYDPLNILATPVVYPRKDYRRYQELEIKHGRISMLACVGVITTEAGFRWPGYLSKSLDLKFSDIPGGALDSWAAVPAEALQAPSSGGGAALDARAAARVRGDGKCVDELFRTAALAAKSAKSALKATLATATMASNGASTVAAGAAPGGAAADAPRST